MNTSIPCRKCGTLHVMTEGSVITSCAICEGIQKPLIVKSGSRVAKTMFEPGRICVMPDELKELEEWCEKNVQVDDRSGFEYIGYDAILAKIQVLREGK